MKIAASLGVKDEVELIDACIAHLRRIGVQQIIVYDMGSTDGTLECLKRQVHFADVELNLLDDRQPGFLHRIDVLNREFLARTDADWMIFLDADEFWIPASGDLRNCASLSASDVLSVRRFNVPVTPAGAMMPVALLPEHYGDLLLLATGVPRLRKKLDREEQAAWIRGVPRPKAMARTGVIEQVMLGGHDVATPATREARRSCPLDLLIAHVPFTTQSRFARKLGNIEQYFRSRDAEASAESSRAWHWRRWNQMTEAEAVKAEFDLQLFPPRRIEKLRERGVIRPATAMLMMD